MQESIVEESPRRHIARRVGAAGMALATMLALGACKATGGGYIGEPADGAIPVVVPNGRANFAFAYNCDPNRVRGRVYTYNDTSTNGLYPRLKIEGVVTTALIDTNDDGMLEPATSCQDLMDAQVAQFEGNYRSLETKYPMPPAVGSRSWYSTRTTRFCRQRSSPATGSP